MPELPEVENVCLGLTQTVVGQTINRVSVRRPDVVRGSCRPGSLLRGQVIQQIDRLGKQFALIGRSTTNEKAPVAPESPACVCIHLGMTGSLRYYPSGDLLKPDNHTHVIWHLQDAGRLAFRDPRRFGGLWTFNSVDSLHESRWSKLGEDALTITPKQLHAGLSATKRALKAALLDQAVVAGLGNIYVDELLFACGLSPLRPACSVSLNETQQMVRRIRALLNRAIRLGGSTLRDYVDTSGRSGGFQLQHRVYGRSGEPCTTCGQELMCTTIAGRTTVYCRGCQSRHKGRQVEGSY